MKLFVPNESTALEKRVALTPDALTRLRKKWPGLDILVGEGAGLAAGYPDAAYIAVGATMVKGKPATAPDILLRITPPDVSSAETLTIGLNAAGHAPLALSLEKLPRTSRAQALDVLSSQANIAGYAAVLLAARHFPRLFPMFMTAAGSSRPANVLVLGVGVAGLQAIATARRLGAQVFAYDVRPEVQEQILSLGAKPVAVSAPHSSGQGGYAAALSPEEQAAQQKALETAITAADVIITTAQVPGKPAPVLVSEAAVESMKPGSVLLDMAAGGYNLANGIKGGNTPLSVANEVVITQGAVTILAPTNLPSQVPGDASRFFAQNMVNLLALLLKDEGGKLSLDYSDELIAAMKSTGTLAEAPKKAADKPAAKPQSKPQSKPKKAK